MNILRSKKIWLHAGLIVLALLILTFLVFNLLKVYTRHGEQIAIPDLSSKMLDEAVSIAEDAGFEVVLTDSVFLVGKPGGMITSQNPEPGAKAKSKRKIYVTITKYSADMVTVGSLPALYGKSYELKKKALAAAYEIKSEVIGHMYDKGAPGMILRVLAGRDTIVNHIGVDMDYTIPRGATLQFILSSNEGGEINVPLLVCQMMDEAIFAYGGQVSIVPKSGSAGDYIISQDPAYSPDAKMLRGTSIIVELSYNRPAECPPEEFDAE